MTRLRSVWGRVPKQVRAVLSKVGEDNVTGLSSMVAFNLLTSLFPFLLLLTFIVGKVMGDESVEQRVVEDLSSLLPSIAAQSVTGFVDSVRRNADAIGLVALVLLLWTGSSAWSAIDNAFGQIYGTGARAWGRQKLFALSMTVLMVVFFTAMLALSTVMTVIQSSNADLPFYLGEISDYAKAITIAVTLLTTLLLFSILYVRVPNRAMHWRAAWPGILFAAFGVTALLQLFPLYLNAVNISRFGAAFGFVFLLVTWFYLVSVVGLVGAELNAIRTRTAMGEHALSPRPDPAPARGDDVTDDVTAQPSD